MSAYHVNYSKMEAAAAELERLRQGFRSISEELVTHTYRMSSAGLGISSMTALKAAFSAKAIKLNAQTARLGSAKTKLELIKNHYLVAETKAVYEFQPTFSGMVEIIHQGGFTYKSGALASLGIFGGAVQIAYKDYQKVKGSLPYKFIKGVKKEYKTIREKGESMNDYLDRLRKTKVGDCVKKVKIGDVVSAAKGAWKDVRDGDTETVLGFVTNTAARVGTKAVKKAITNVIAIGLTSIVVTAIPALVPFAPVIKVGLSVCTDVVINKAAESISGGSFKSFDDMAGHYAGKLGDYLQHKAGEGAKQLRNTCPVSLFNPFSSVPKALGNMRAFGFG